MCERWRERVGEREAVKGRSDGVDASGRVLGFPASDNLCGMENELFALTCLLKTYGSGTVLRNGMK